MGHWVLAWIVTAAGATGPLKVVMKADTEVRSMLQSGVASVDKLAMVADVYIDFSELARRAMGRDWASLSAAQRTEFSQTMKALLRASYAQKALADGRGDAKIEYGDEKIDGDEAEIRTTLVTPEDRFPVVYRLYRSSPKASWRIYDVITDDVSLVATYNDQFRQVIAKKGFAGLLKSLKAKSEQLVRSSDPKD